jgi:hypothetical protein
MLHDGKFHIGNELAGRRNPTCTETR